MKSLLGYVRHYYFSLNKSVFLLTSLLVAALIIINYTMGIESRVSNLKYFPERFSGFFLLYSFTFSFGYWIHFAQTKYFPPRQLAFYILLFITSAIFACKIGWRDSTLLFTQQLDEPWRLYWQLTLDWPVKAIAVLLVIVLLWKAFRYGSPVAGMTTRNFSAKPYVLLLLCMLPLVTFASMQPDFLLTYPKLRKIDFIPSFANSPWKNNLLYELAYGSDFFTIELFFRGMLVLGFVRFAGKDAILPMAAFYCTIHFGKPLLECISSYFGGIILGVIVYRTRSIWGGLITHLGVAWLMELAGYIARISYSGEVSN